MKTSDRFRSKRKKKKMSALIKLYMDPWNYVSGNLLYIYLT